MSYKIVVDSCCELPEELKGDPRFEIVPLGIEVGDWHIQDDAGFNQAEFLKKVAECPTCPRSSCPSPDRYKQSFDCDADHIYVVTLSANLSGSHNSAVLGKNLYEEKHKDKKIHVVDSRSASCGEAQIALKAMELEEQGLSFEEIVKRLEDFRDEMNTYFVHSQYKARYGRNGGGNHYPAGTGHRLQESPAEAGGYCCPGDEEPSEKMPYDHPLQQSGQGRERAADDSG